MAIITISRGSFSKGKDVAEKVAEKLGYACIAREVVLEASKGFNIPEIRMLQAIHDAPSLLERFTFGKEKYITYFQTALLRYLRADNIVYHGLAGHFFVKGVAHVLKVRIIADLNERIRLEVSRKGISPDEARNSIQRDDEERRKWSLQLYGIDTSDPGLYDLTIRIRKVSVEHAADIICHAIAHEEFRTTAESRQALENLLLASEVKSALIEKRPDIQVVARSGAIIIGTRSRVLEEPELVKAIEQTAHSISGVKSVEVKVAHTVDWTD